MMAIKLNVITGRVLPPVRALIEASLVLGLCIILAHGIWFALYGASARPLDTSLSLSPRTSQSQSFVQVDFGRLRDGRLFAGRRVQTSSEEIEAPETQLNLVLHGVRRGDDPESGTAIIGGTGDNQRTYAVGHSILDGVRLIAVYPDRVIINRRGARESLYLREEAREQSTSLLRPVQEGAPAAMTSQTVRNPAPVSFTKDDWVRGVRVEPYRQDGRVLGYRIQSQSRSDLLDVISLQVGDVITEIDGRATQDPTSFFTAIERVADANRIRLTVLRGGEVQTIEAQLQ